MSLPAKLPSLARALGVPLKASRVSEPVPHDALTPTESAQFGRLRTAQRREDWRRGRAALKSVLGALGESPETGGLLFPHPRLSLSHSGPVAVAVAVDGACPQVAGIGVDFERARAPRFETARFFLDDEEHGWLRARSQADRAQHLLRMWTIKEAVFKADPENAEAALFDYHLVDPACDNGVATRGVRRFSYATCHVGDGVLSIAISLKGK